MKCQNCGENEATVRYMQIMNGNKEEIFVCEKCASKLKLDMNFKFGLDDIFSSFLGEGTFLTPIEISESLVCDACGTRYEDFVKNGMLGCENCYQVFSKRLDNVLKKLHGNNRHIEDSERIKPAINKAPKVKDQQKAIEEEINELKVKLQECIKCEDYEQAAVIRDKIKGLEKKLQKQLKEKERGE